MPPSQPPAAAWRAVRVAAVVLLAALAFLPIANWIPGGPDADWYDLVRRLWVFGGIIVGGAALVLAITARRTGGRFAPLGRRLASLPLPRWRVAAAALTLLALATYAFVATDVFSRRPLLIDEVVQLFQARIFEAGRLWLPSTGHPGLFGSLHLVDAGGKVYGQFPPGGPALLALGDVFGAAWLVGPACGAVAVAAWLAYLRRSGEGRTTRWLAALLFAFAPFTVFQSASHMNHGFTLAALLVATAALAAVVTSETPRPWLGLLTGLGYGAAAAIRPADAAAFALPAAAWLLVRAARDRRRIGELLAAGLGVALPLVAVFWFNANTTGDPFLFGYQVLWGPEHNLGFHRAPWGPVHTPVRGLELVNVYLLRLQTYLFESPVPSLVPAFAALALAPALTALDRYLLASGGLLTAFYFAYWHNGFFLGPRFLYPLVPLLALWTARLPGLVRARFGRGLPYLFVVAAFVVSAAMALTLQVPARALQYRNGLVTMRWDADAAAREAGVRSALVLVRESWGSELAARMWQLGLSPAETGRLYRSIDACELEVSLTGAEARGLRGRALLGALAPLRSDSLRVVSSPLSPDTTERYLPGLTYPLPCVAKVLQDRRGFTLYTPLLLARRGDNVYARDLHAQDTAALALFPGRPIWLVKPPGAAEGEVPRFYRASRDSLAAAWGVPRALLGDEATPRPAP